MKNIFFVFAATLLLFACNKNSTTVVIPDSTGNVISGGGTGGTVAGTPPSNPLIVGKWVQVSDTTLLYTNGVLMQTLIEGKQTTTAYQFNADGTGLQDSLYSFTYTLSGKSLIVNTPAYSSGGISVSAATLPCTVKALTATSLYLYFDQSYTVTGTGATSGPSGQAQQGHTLEAKHLVKQ